MIRGNQVCAKYAQPARFSLFLGGVHVEEVMEGKTDDNQSERMLILVNPCTFTTPSNAVSLT